jgi:hypothetical protein
MPEHAIVGQLLKWRTSEVGRIPHPTGPQQLIAERHQMIDFRDPETG